MYRETTELTYSHQDLGTLSEFGLMTLFGNLHSKALVDGLESTVEDIRDAHARHLYPAYFHTHLRIPTACSLSQFRAWREVALGVDVQRFGKCYLDSSYVIKPVAAGAVDPVDFTSGAYPTMHGNNLFIVDVSEDAEVARQLAVPESGSLAALPPIKAKPPAINRAKQVANERRIHPERGMPWTSRDSIAYRVMPGRDVAPGHAMIFARFAQVMDYAEHVMLADQMELMLTPDELAGNELVEREIFYFGNAYAGDTIDVGVKATVTETAGLLYWEAEYQLYRRSNLELLAVGYAKKRVQEEAARQAFLERAVSARILDHTHG